MTASARTEGRKQRIREERRKSANQLFNDFTYGLNREQLRELVHLLAFLVIELSELHDD